MGVPAGFAYRPMSLGKQLKAASEQRARRCIIVGDEIHQGHLAVKDLSTGTQELVAVDRLLSDVAR